MGTDLERKGNYRDKNLSTEKDCVCTHVLSHVRLLVTPWTIACQVPLSMGFSWQGYWSGLPFLPAGDGMKHQHCRVVWNFLLLTPCFLPLLYFISFVQQSTESCLQALPNLPYTLVPTLPPGLLPFFLTQGSNLGLLCLLHCRQIITEPLGKPSINKVQSILHQNIWVGQEWLIFCCLQNLFLNLIHLLFA